MHMFEFINDFRALKTSPVAPFHDDLILQAFVADCVERHKVSSFVETGTFRADTLLWFASKYPEMPCYSVESNGTFYRFALGRAFRYNNVSIIHGDSRQFLETLDGLGTPLFWLDAHWKSDWPLLEELRIIQKRHCPSIVLIDDFQIADNPGFGFDSYNGRALNLDYIEHSFYNSHEIRLPTYEPQKDARGVCAIFFGMQGSGEPWFKALR